MTFIPDEPGEIGWSANADAPGDLSVPAPGSGGPASSEPPPAEPPTVEDVVQVDVPEAAEVEAPVAEESAAVEPAVVEGFLAGADPLGETVTEPESAPVPRSDWR